MIGFSSSQRYFLFRPCTDMRKSFNGLCGLVSNSLKRNLLSGDVFIFINRDRNRIKLLVWDRSGFVIWYKRLEEGTFELPAIGEAQTDIEIKWSQLVLILEGIQLGSIKQRSRYSHSA